MHSNEIRMAVNTFFEKNYIFVVFSIVWWIVWSWRGRYCYTFGKKRGGLVNLHIIFSFLLFLSFQAYGTAIDVHEFGSDEDRGRYRVLIDELRCPKCQNQNLSDSNSQIAIDLRDEVARMVQEGQTDDQIIDFMVTRYGDFVLYRPPVQSNTMVLWVGPSVMFGLGLLVFGIIIFRRSKAADDADDELEDDSNN